MSPILCAEESLWASLRVQVPNDKVLGFGVIVIIGKVFDYWVLGPLGFMVCRVQGLIGFRVYRTEASTADLELGSLWMELRA